MALRATLIGVVWLMTVPVHATSSPTTLRELAVSALRTNENVAIAENNVARSESRVKLARSLLMPSLTLNGTTTWYQEEATIDLGEGDPFVIVPSNDWSWSADLQQTLFSGLRDWRARDVARLERDRAELEYHTAANNLVLDVAASFLIATSDAERVSVAQSTLEQIESQLRVAERRFEVGETAVADVARWRSERAAAFQRLVTAQGAAALSMRRLERLTGVRDIKELQPLGSVSTPPGSDSDLVELALRQRLEMAALEHQIEAAGLMVKIEKGNWLPSLDARVQYFQQKAAFPTNDWMSVALVARVPIYDGGLTAARVAEARQDVRDVELLTRQVRKGIADQVDSATIGYRAAVASDDAARERVAAAEEAYTQVERAYRVGEASATDLLTTTAEQTDAQTTAIIARAQREYQAIALRHAVGTTPLPDLDPMTILNPQTETQE